MFDTEGFTRKAIIRASTMDRGEWDEFVAYCATVVNLMSWNGQLDIEQSREAQKRISILYSLCDRCSPQ